MPKFNRRQFLGSTAVAAENAIKAIEAGRV